MKLTDKKKLTITQKGMAWFLFAAFCVSLLPVLGAAFYATPRGDDFSFGSAPHHAFLAGQGLPGVIRAAFGNMKDVYYSWQGSYSAIVFFSLMTGIFGPQYYWIGVFFLIAMVYVPTFLLAHVLMCRWLRMPKQSFLLTASAMSLSMLWFIPSSGEGIYWYNGAAYYVLFYGFMELLAVVLIHAVLTDSAAGRSCLFLLGCMLAVIVGGGNLVTALLSSVLLVLGCAAAFAKRSRSRWWLLVVCGCLLVGFAFNILAPGNRVRGSGSLGTAPVRAILHSFYSAASLLIIRIRPGTAAMYLLMFPVILQAAQKCTWKFRFPIPVIGLAFCVFACQFTPGEYAIKGQFPPRMQNIMFYFMHWWILFTLFYLLGWLTHPHGKAAKQLDAEAVFGWFRKKAVWVASAAALCFAVGACFWAPGQNVRTVTPLAAAVAMARKQPQRTYREFLAMDEQLKNASKEDVVYLKNLWVNHNVAFHLGIEPTETGDDYWVNLAMADYYDVKQILLDTN